MLSASTDNNIYGETIFNANQATQVGPFYTHISKAGSAILDL